MSAAHQCKMGDDALISIPRASMPRGNDEHSSPARVSWSRIARLSTAASNHGTGNMACHETMCVFEYKIEIGLFVR
eukprot:4017842-Prorocentrum_lima.AAC.1